MMSNNVVIVTGASKGIGLATTELLVEEGAQVVAVSRRPSPSLEGLGARVLHVSADLTPSDAPSTVVAAARERFGRLDALVNNVGGPPPGTTMPVFGFLDRTDADWYAMLEFNLLSAMRMCREAIPLMIDSGGGAIGERVVHPRDGAIRRQCRLRRGEGGTAQPHQGARRRVRTARDPRERGHR